MTQRSSQRSLRHSQYYGTVEFVVSWDQGGRIRKVGRFRVEPSSDIDYVSLV